VLFPVPGIPASMTSVNGSSAIVRLLGSGSPGYPEKQSVLITLLLDPGEPHNGLSTIDSRPSTIDYG